MTDIYEETILISCDRESAQTKQDDGLNSTWTNNFNNTLQLEPGDKVSVYNSFVSEMKICQTVVSTYVCYLSSGV